jgi:hypothetical protein
MIATPGGIEGMFRHAGRDLTTPRAGGFEIPAFLLQEASKLYDGVIVGPRADPARRPGCEPRALGGRSATWRTAGPLFTSEA